MTHPADHPARPDPFSRGRRTSRRRDPLLFLSPTKEYPMKIRNIRSRKGAALVEYGLLIAGVGLVATAAISVFGHKTSDLISSIASVLPGAHEDDNAPIVSGKIIETTSAADGDISIDTAAIEGNSNSSRLGDNLGVTIDALVVEAGE